MRTSLVISPVLAADNSSQSCRVSGRKFDVKTLPADLNRVYKRLQEKFGEEYALTVVFVIRTAVELHRAWHMTLLTSRLLQQIKDRFQLRMSWNLGVTDLVFRVEDGLYELQRRVPYDYDSEYQDMYEKAAVALIEGHIGIHDALIFQSELKDGKHTSRSGLFLRENPGRLVLYPLQAATCCVIFFGGDWVDAGIAAVCGLTAGLIEGVLSSKRVFANVNDSKMLIDFLIGVSTGVIGGLFYYFMNSQDDLCLKGVFLGTLYWFFYGTAFVIGLLEIIAGELQTGVTRFLAVSVKTFVLSVGSAVGMTLVLAETVYEEWTNQFDPEANKCNSIDLSEKWWRLPLFILCSVSVLGQYRFIIMNYWAGLLVQVAAYEAQYRVMGYYDKAHEFDGMDTVFADLAGAMAAVFAASMVCFFIDNLRHYSNLSVVGKSAEETKLSRSGQLTNKIYECLVFVGSSLGLGRGLFRRHANCEKKLSEIAKAEGKNKMEVRLSVEEEATMVEAAVEAQETNVWSLLMPAVYQLVPGSKLAQFWYKLIFPSEESTGIVDSPETALWLTSVALALGLILGLTAVRLLGFFLITIASCVRKKIESEDDEIGKSTRQRERRGVTAQSNDFDPSDLVWEKEFDLKYGVNASTDSNDENKPSDSSEEIVMVCSA